MRLKNTLQRLLLFFLGCFFASFAQAQSKFTISGFVRDASSGERFGGISISAVSIADAFPKPVQTTTNSYGFYSLTVDGGKTQTILVNMPGYDSKAFNWSGTKDSTANLEIVPLEDLDKIEEVNIVSKKNTVADKVEMSKVDIPVNQIKDIPALLGEKDVLKVIQLMPGVQKGGEGQSGIYVRGGGPDQNLLILDEAIVYNATHLFGFFSVFNGDALKSVELVKGGFPSRYGGRLSSVIDLTMKEGNNQKYSGEVGIGMIGSRFTFEGPIKKGKSSFMISGRRTYLDVLMQPFIMLASNGGNLGYYFYDFNAKANYEISDKDKLYVSGYFGQDKFYATIKDGDYKLISDFGWGNRTLTTRWNHVFNPRLFSNASLIYSHYKLGISVEDRSPFDTFSLKYQSLINDIGIKYDFDWRPAPDHQVRFGISSIRHQFSPGAVVVKGGFDFNINRAIKNIITVESGIYIEDQWKLGKLQLYPGFRLSHYQVDKTQYVFPEPRLSVAYNLNRTLSVKGSYARMNQYIHLLSNSGISLPTDLWVPATAKIAPMSSEQTAVGIAKDLKGGYSITLEGYYKHMNNVIQYKEGASFLLGSDDLFDMQAPTDSRNWENAITAGQGWSYGTELFLQKKIGKLSGWVGYTLSWTQLKFPELNQGKVFWAKYDRRHDISIVGIYKASKRLTFSATWVYGTGNAITAPQGLIPGNGHSMSKFPIIWSPQFQNQGNWLTDYGSRNSFRMEAYHRLDIGMQFHREKRRGRETWELSFYNAYNRFNPFFYYGSTSYNWQTGEEYWGLKKVTLFPIIPSLSWSFKFR